MSMHPSRTIFQPMACMLIGMLLISDAIASTKTLSKEALLNAEKAAVEARKKIQSGHFIVSVSYSTFLRDPSYTKSKWRYETFVNATEQRANVAVYLSGKRMSENAIVLTKNNFIRAPLSDDSVIEVSGPTSRPSTTLEIPDPRFLGFIPWPFATISQFGLEEYVLRADRSSVSAKLQEIQGEPVVEVLQQFNLGGEASFAEYRLAVNKGYQPTYVATWCGKGDKRSFFSAESTLAYHKNERLWFPEKVVLRMKTGETLIGEEIDTVELADLNKNIDKAKFALAGLGLKPGRLVANDEKLMWWTGENLIRKGAGQDTYVPVSIKNQSDPNGANNNRGGWRGRFLVANTIMLAVLPAILIMRRILKRQRHS